MPINIKLTAGLEEVITDTVCAIADDCSADESAKKNGASGGGGAKVGGGVDAADSTGDSAAVGAGSDDGSVGAG